MVDDKKPTTSACYQIALCRLRQMYDDDFHEILAAVYEEYGLIVKKRRSRLQSKRQRAQEVVVVEPTVVPTEVIPV